MSDREIISKAMEITLQEHPLKGLEKNEENDTMFRNFLIENIKKLDTKKKFIYDNSVDIPIPDFLYEEEFYDQRRSH